MATVVKATPLAPRCGLCKTPVSPLTCSVCRVMRYCSQEHQAAHRPSHQTECDGVTRERKAFDVAEQGVRSQEEDWKKLDWELVDYDDESWWLFFTGPNLDTRDYARAGYALLEALGRVNTHAAAVARLDLAVDILQKGWIGVSGDAYCVRRALEIVLPSLMLRLGRDQESYDCTVWYETLSVRQQQADSRLERYPQFLDIQGADALFEDPKKVFDFEFPCLSHLVAVLLIKIKLLLDMKALRAGSAAVARAVPREILDSIRSHIPWSPIVASNRAVMRQTADAAMADTIAMLIAHVQTLFEAVASANQHLLPALVQPETSPAALPASWPPRNDDDRCEPGSLDEMRVVLHDSYDLWHETPGAIEQILERLQKAGASVGPE